MIDLGTFEFDPLSEFVVFEIPTFLLFSVLIFAIYSWKSVVYSKGFFPATTNKYIVIFGLAFVWSLWIVVTVVYAEVVLGMRFGFEIERERIFMEIFFCLLIIFVFFVASLYS